MLLVLFAFFRYAVFVYIFVIKYYLHSISFFFDLFVRRAENSTLSASECFNLQLPWNALTLHFCSTAFDSAASAVIARPLIVNNNTKRWPEKKADNMNKLQFDSTSCILILRSLVVRTIAQLLILSQHELHCITYEPLFSVTSAVNVTVMQSELK